jgi:hypothetical protein
LYFFLLRQVEKVAKIKTVRKKWRQNWKRRLRRDTSDAVNFL